MHRLSLAANRTLIHTSNPEARIASSSVRAISHVNLKGDANAFVTSLGYKFAWEFVRQGTVFLSDGWKLVVSKIFEVCIPLMVQNSFNIHSSDFAVRYSNCSA